MKNVEKHNKQGLSQIHLLTFLYASCGELLLNYIFRLSVAESVMLIKWFQTKAFFPQIITSLLLAYHRQPE